MRLAFFVVGSTSTILNGVPSDLIPYLPQTFPDATLSVCEVPRGSGLVVGVCKPSSSLDLPFCGEYVTYSTCVPSSNPVWPSWDSLKKDSVVERLFNEYLANRQEEEMASLEDHSTYIPLLFTGNDECVKAYKKVLCLYNFPECVDSNESINGLSRATSLPMCSDVCKGFMSACKLEESSFCQPPTWPLTGGIKVLGDSGMLANQECTGKGYIPTGALTTLVFLIIFFA
jgi:hypothetical protein